MKLFNKQWMSNLNPDLLKRYWLKKGAPDTLKLVSYGITIFHVMTPFGVCVYVGSSKEILKEVI